MNPAERLTALLVTQNALDAAMAAAAQGDQADREEDR